MPYIFDLLENNSLHTNTKTPSPVRDDLRKPCLKTAKYI